jgi:hypothetical protein
MHTLLQCSTVPSPPKAKQQSQQQQHPQQQQPQHAQPAAPALSLGDFVDMVVPACPDPHWQPQSARVSESIWSTINFVGHMDHVETDAEQLLRVTGLWDEFGATGWGRLRHTSGKNGSDSGSDPVDSIFHDTASVHHATDSAHRLREYYTEALEQVVERLYRSDYQNPVLNLTLNRILLLGDQDEAVGNGNRSDGNGSDEHEPDENKDERV